MLAGLWAEVLEQERVGLNEDFFEAGGHSLLATLLLTKIREAFYVELPLRVLFDSPTIEQLAAEIDRLRGGDSGAEFSAPMQMQIPRLDRGAAAKIPEDAQES